MKTGRSEKESGAAARRGSNKKSNVPRQSNASSKTSATSRNRGGSSGRGQPKKDDVKDTTSPTAGRAGSVNRKSGKTSGTEAVGGPSKREPRRSSTKASATETNRSARRRSSTRTAVPSGKSSQTAKRRSDKEATKTTVDDQTQAEADQKDNPANAKQTRPGRSGNATGTLVDEPSVREGPPPPPDAAGSGRPTPNPQIVIPAPVYFATPGKQVPVPQPVARSPRCPAMKPAQGLAKATGTKDALAAGFFGELPPTLPGETPTGAAAMGRRIAALIINKGVRGIREEYYAIKSVLPQNLTHDQFKNNMDKNRYQDVICADQSRVVLDGPGTDYIHASWVNGYGSEEARKFICTQGPTSDTCGDFWRMVQQYQCVAIVMLCQFVEKNKPKCEPYYPTNLGGEMRFGDIAVRNKGNKLVDVDTKQGKVPSQSFIYTELQVEKSNKVAQTVGHWQWPTWPDKGVPDCSDIAFQLLDLLDPNTTRLPIVVHCSAGIGRTGTLVFMDICRSYLDARTKRDESPADANDDVDFLRDNLLKIRRQRMLSIQTEVQYVFVHRAILDLCVSRGWVDGKSAEVTNFVQTSDLLFTSRNPTA